MLAVYAAAALAVALIGARYLQGVPVAGGGQPKASVVSLGSGDTRSRKPGSARLVLHVTGAVKRPGLVEVREGDRVGDAIRRAGGPLRGADLTGVNLAMRVADGQQVIVPDRAAAATAAGPSAPVSLNSATLEQLDTLDGVGPGLAQKIVAARDQHGGLRSVDDLADVPGIGEKRLESLRAQLQP